MTYADFAFPLLPQIFGWMDSLGRAGPNEVREAAGDNADDARQRSDFALEMLSRNSSAFSSEADVQSMMSHFSRRF